MSKSAPDFSLPGVDGKTYSLPSGKPFVIVFACNHCPYVQKAEPALIALQKKYGCLLAINSNDDEGYPEDSFENMVKRAEEKGLNYPYLRDADQTVAKAYGATHTPQLFVYDKDRRLAYTGGVDGAGAALDDLLAGRPVRVPETHAIGCTIKWR